MNPNKRAITKWFTGLKFNSKHNYSLWLKATSATQMKKQISIVVVSSKILIFEAQFLFSTPRHRIEISSQIKPLIWSSLHIM